MRKIFSKELFWVVLILFAAAFLRLFGLGRLGAGFFRDEAALGYNAYSILKTGKDEFAQSFPIIFRSFEVFFLPLYVYLSVPIMALFGLTSMSARLLSALSGILLVGFSFLIAKEVWGEKKKGLVIGVLGLMAAVPWSLFYSRGAFEGNLGLALFSVACWLMLRFINKKTKSLTLMFLFLVLSMYSYQAERLVVPLWLGACMLSVKKMWWDRKKRLLKQMLPAIIIGLPLFLIWFSPAGLHRAVGVSLLEAGSIPGFNTSVKAAFFTNNKPYLILNKIAAMYVSFYSPRNLFWELDYDKQRHLVGQASLFFWLVPGFFWGLYKGVNESLSKNKKVMPLMWWLAFGPLPAALTSDPFHTYRALLVFLPITIISAWGMWDLWNRLKNQKVKLLAGFSIIFLLIFSWSRTISSYLIVTPSQRAVEWDYVFKNTVAALNKYQDLAEKIVWDTSYSEPYIHYLFWAKFDPAKLQETTKNLKLDYYADIGKVRFLNLEKIYFEEVDWPTRRGDSSTIFIVPDKKVPVSEFATDPNVGMLEELLLPDGKVMFRLLKIK